MADEPGKTATLQTPGGELETTIRPATDGASAFEISKLLSSTGMTTYDPGYGNTAPVSSRITYIDGDAGILRYRGYPIEQLAEQSTFVETAYLLIWGELPTRQLRNAKRPFHGLEWVLLRLLASSGERPRRDASPGQSLFLVR